jgi:beta-glucosidase
MKKTIFLAILFTVSVKAQVYKDIRADVETRVEDLISKMTPEEKLGYINGINWMYTKPIERLGIPSFKMTDGPVGTTTHGKTTAYPASILSAASWDLPLINKLGIALGKDSRAKGVNMLLGPGVNIARAPMTGRNFEYTGEDPFLSSQVAVNYITGVQSQGVVATVKHFAANNQEYDRNFISSDIDERTLHEIYLPAFKAAVQKGKVGAVMNSYNLLNGEHTSQNSRLNNEILKRQWGFDGILMSDWGGVHNGIAAFNGGTDIEMPGNEHMKSEVLMEALKKGEITQKMLNDKVRRLLRIFFRFGFFDRPQAIPSFPEDSDESAAVALDLAKGGIVLLKNENSILPLNLSKSKRVAFIGPNADTYNAGGGSSYTQPFHYTSTLKGFKEIAKDTEVTYTMGVPSLNYLSAKSVFYTARGSNEVGLKAEYFNNTSLNGTPKAVKTESVVDHEWVQTPGIEGIGQDNFSVRWSGVIRPVQTTTYKFTVKGDDGYRLWVNNKMVIDHWGDHGFEEKSTSLPLEAGKEYDIKLEYYEGGGDAAIVLAWFKPEDENFNEAIAMAKNADVVFLCVGFNKQVEHEGAERPFELPEVQETLINVVAKANSNVVVLLNAGGNVYMKNWLPSVKGLIHTFYPGQEGGRAIAEILLGKTNPSGKLPVSFEKEWADNPTYNNYYDTDNDKHVAYKEGVFVGYRYYDSKKVEPLFPFGFGLSYTTFKYSNVKVEMKQTKRKISAVVNFDITNTGKADGAEVAQLYVSELKSKVNRPLKELKGFAKVFIKQGQTKNISISLDESAFSYYKVNESNFGFDNGDFEILIGSSSKDIKLKKIVKIN